MCIQFNERYEWLGKHGARMFVVHIQNNTCFPLLVDNYWVEMLSYFVIFVHFPFLEVNHRLAMMTALMMMICPTRGPQRPFRCLDDKWTFWKKKKGLWLLNDRLACDPWWCFFFVMYYCYMINILLLSSSQFFLITYLGIVKDQRKAPTLPLFFL